MGESDKLLLKKSAKKSHNSKSKQQHKLFANQDDYGTLTKQYIVEDELPRTHFSALHCIVVSFVFIFSAVFIATSLLIGLPRVRQRYQEFQNLNLETFNATTISQSTIYSTTIESLI